MLTILLITAPIYLLIALGFAAVRSGVFDKAAIRAMGRFVVLFCVPSLLLQSLTQHPLGEVMAWGYLLAYLGGSLLAAVVIFLYARRVRGQSFQHAAVWSLTGSVANSAFIGYPVVHQFVGPPAAVGLAMCMIVENLVMMPLCLALADSAGTTGGWRAALARSLRGLVRNPLILAIVAGVALGLLDWQLPAVVGRVLQMLAAVASPVALFVVGGTLVGLRVGGVLRDAIELTAFKLVLHPLAVLLLLWLLPPLAPSLHATALVFAAMPMATIVPVLAQRYQQQELCAAALMLATLTSFATLTLWMMVA